MMSSSAEEGSREYGDVEMDERGRLTIPAALREELGLGAGASFTVVRDGTDIRLVSDPPELATLTAGKSGDEWAGVAFRDAGAWTFGGD